MTINIHIAHSPDTDDYFMFIPLLEGKVGDGSIRYTSEAHEIQVLNERALDQRYDVTALSVHGYAYVAQQYNLLRSGASMGEKDYGPMVVAQEAITIDTLKNKVIAVPGKRTTAYLYLQLALGPVETIELPFEEVLPAVQDGRADAGLLVHEAQLQYQDMGLHNVLPLYQWWHERTQLPMALGVNAIRSDLPVDIQAKVSQDISDSITYGLQHRKETIATSKRIAKDLPFDMLDQYIDMYVNQRTVRMGTEEVTATEHILRDAAAAGLIPEQPTLEWA